MSIERSQLKYEFFCAWHNLLEQKSNVTTLLQSSATEWCSVSAIQNGDTSPCACLACVYVCVRAWVVGGRVCVILILCVCVWQLWPGQDVCLNSDGTGWRVINTRLYYMYYTWLSPHGTETGSFDPFLGGCFSGQEVAHILKLRKLRVFETFFFNTKSPKIQKIKLH